MGAMTNNAKTFHGINIIISNSFAISRKLQ